jgi:hypothetical protein
MRMRIQKKVDPPFKLGDKYWIIPHLAYDRITRKQLKELLLSNTASFGIFACGTFWDIVHRHIGVGVYEIRLKKRYSKED